MYMSHERGTNNAHHTSPRDTCVLKLVATTECHCEKLCMLQPVSISGIVGSC